MSYNLTVVDASGEAFTAFLAPDTEPEFFRTPLATNHRGTVPEFPERAAALRSVPRQERLSALVATRPAPEELADAFLAPPLFNNKYSRAFGTLYTALYRPAEGIVEYRWPDQRWQLGFDDTDDTREVLLIGS